MSWRGVVISLVTAVPVVGSASFGYGFYLLIRGPRTRGPQGEELRSILEPAERAAILARAQAHIDKNEVEQGVLDYRRILVAQPADSEALLGLGNGERRAGREEVAVREYERVLRHDPRNPAALGAVAELASHRKDTWGRAEQAYRAYLEVKPGDGEARLALARLLVWRGETAEAAESFSGVKPLLTQKDQRDYALALVKAGRAGEAEPLLKGFLAADPKDPDVNMAMGGILASRSDWPRALPLLRAALAARPDDPLANLAYGQGLLSTKEFAAALAPLEKARNALPQNGAAGLAFARALRGAGDARRAEHEFERVFPMFAEDPEVAREYGDLLMERRNTQRAEAVYRQATAKGLRDDRLLASLAHALDANGKPKEAVPLLEEAYAAKPSGRLAYDLARLYQKLGQNDRALRLLAEIERSGSPRP